MRAVASVEDSRVRLRTTRRADVAVGYPELSRLGDAVAGRPAVLDGEIVAFDDSGSPSFARLAERMHVLDPGTAAARAAVTPVAYVVFDVLHFDGLDCWQLPYLERRRLLADLVEPGEHWQVPGHRIGGGAALLDAVRSQDLEGIVAKRPDRPYEPGRRSPSWRKIKVRHVQEFVVGGWIPGGGNRQGHMGSLMLGCHRDDALHWVGNVGTGFTVAELSRLDAKLSTLDTSDCPFVVRPSGPGSKGARYVRPELVVQVEFGEWTPDERLRHPAYLGERIDKDPFEVTCDA
jgi:bifunctional non-homologous end joining protein LigD